MGATSDACLKHGGQTLYTVHKNHTHHLQKKKICVVSEFGHLEKPTENKFGNEAEHNLTGIYLMLYWASFVSKEEKKSTHMTGRQYTTITTTNTDP